MPLATPVQDPRGTRPAIERMHLMAGWLRDGQHFTAKTIARRFECSTKTVMRDLEFMADRLGWDIAWDRTLGTYTLRSAPEPVL